MSNRLYSSVVRIQKERGHRVIGPYRLVRHPGNLGNMLLNLAAPFMLESDWVWIPAGARIVLLVVRTALIELPGYEDYAGRTRGRLIPGIW